MMIKEHPSYIYLKQVEKGEKPVPKYVIKQCKDLKKIFDKKSKKYVIDIARLDKIDKLLKILKMPKGLKVNQNIYESLAGFQWVLIVATLCVVHKEDMKKRRYETILLEICRKNGKTFIIGLIFVLLFFLEPKFSKFYSVAPDGSLSREIKGAIEEIIRFNSDILPLEGPYKKFKIRRDDIYCYTTDSDYIPLSYSTSRLDGKLPSVFCADEVGALPTSYPIEAMRSGQLTILNKLGCIISTKYPTFDNPLEDEVFYAKKVLDGAIEDDKVFALLFEPDDTKNWTTNDEILKQGNPLAVEVPEIWEDLIDKRKRAIEVESARENFLCKHCNIIYQGLGTESFVPISAVMECKQKEKINFEGKKVYVGVDLAMTNDNCAVSIAYEDNGHIYANSFAFIPEGRIDEKNKFEKIDYRRYIKDGSCIACGDLTVSYKVIEDFVFDIENKFGCKIVSIGFDKWNALSSAQKWDEKYTTVEVRQHSDTLHPPTKLLYEKILNKEFHYNDNKLLEINFENAKCTYDTNLNRYITKKKSNGKVDMVMSLINAIYLMQQDIIFDSGFVVQTI